MINEVEWHVDAAVQIQGFWIPKEIMCDMNSVLDFRFVKEIVPFTILFLDFLNCKKSFHIRACLDFLNRKILFWIRMWCGDVMLSIYVFVWIDFHFGCCMWCHEIQISKAQFICFKIRKEDVENKDTIFVMGVMGSSNLT